MNFTITSYLTLTKILQCLGSYNVSRWHFWHCITGGHFWAKVNKGDKSQSMRELKTEEHWIAQTRTVSSKTWQVGPAIIYSRLQTAALRPDPTGTQPNMHYLAGYFKTNPVPIGYAYFIYRIFQKSGYLTIHCVSKKSSPFCFSQ